MCTLNMMHIVTAGTLTRAMTSCGYFYAAPVTGVQIVFSGLLTESHTAGLLWIVTHCGTAYCRGQECFLRVILTLWQRRGQLCDESRMQLDRRLPSSKLSCSRDNADSSILSYKLQPPPDMSSCLSIIFRNQNLKTRPQEGICCR